MGTDVSQISSHHYITAVFPSSKSIYSPSYAQQNALLTLSHPPFPDNIPHNCKHRSGRKQTNRLLAIRRVIPRSGLHWSLRVWELWCQRTELQGNGVVGLRYWPCIWMSTKVLCLYQLLGSDETLNSESCRNEGTPSRCMANCRSI